MSKPYKDFEPKWFTERAPQKSYRSIFKWGDPDAFKVPKENLIGKPGEGWTYAKYLLQFERGNPYAPGLRRSLAKTRKIAAQATEIS